MSNYLKKTLFSLLVFAIPYVNSASKAMDNLTLNLDLPEKTVLFKIRNVQDPFFLKGQEIGLVSDEDKTITESKKLWVLEQTRERGQYLIRNFYNGDVLKVSENFFGNIAVTLGAEEAFSRNQMWEIRKRTDGQHDFYTINDVHKYLSLQGNVNNVVLEKEVNNARHQRWLFIPTYGFLPVANKPQLPLGVPSGGR